MHWMNEMDVERAARRWSQHPVLGAAAATLVSLMEAVNSSSDGWPYWKPPSRAASGLFELIERDGTSEWFRGDREDATEAELKRAFRTLKSFRTRYGLAFDIVGPGGDRPYEIQLRLV